MLCLVLLLLLLLAGSGNMSSAPWPLPQTCTERPCQHTLRTVSTTVTCSAYKNGYHASLWRYRHRTSFHSISYNVKIKIKRSNMQYIFHEIRDISAEQLSMICCLALSQFNFRVCSNQSQVKMSAPPWVSLLAGLPPLRAIIIKQSSDQVIR